MSYYLGLKINACFLSQSCVKLYSRPSRACQHVKPERGANNIIITINRQPWQSAHIDYDLKVIQINCLCGHTELNDFYL